MSSCLVPRKWTNQFIEECSTFVATSPSFPFSSGESTIRKTASMSGVRKSGSSHKYRTLADSFSKRYESQITNATHSMENSLSRLSCMKAKHDHRSTTTLKKKEKENQQHTNQSINTKNTSVSAVSPPIVTNTIHTIHTIFVPAPSLILKTVPHLFQNQSNQPIHLIGRPFSAPKATFNYVSPFITNSPNSILQLSHPSQATILR